MKLARHNHRARHTSCRMNGTERRYAEHLRLLELAGEIAGFRFEAVKFRLADKTFYTPDFMVFANDGAVELHEVKGHWEDDARVKIKVFAEMYPFRVIAAQPSKDGWKTEEFTK